MIRQFPEFTSLDINLQAEIKKFTSKFEPYSDFNFVSLYSWDVAKETSVSYLNDNLIVKMRDYLVDKELVSILGVNKIDASIEKIFNDYDGLNKLDLVPDTTVRAINLSGQYIIEEDRNAFDYIYSVDDFLTMNGNGYKKHRQHINNFKSRYGDKISIEVFDATKHSHKEAILDICFSWKACKNHDFETFEDEILAIKRLLEDAENLNICGILVFINYKAVGFAINEVIDENYAIAHFEKANSAYEHITPFLKYKSVNSVVKHNIKYINYEQDLGIEGLRVAKSRYHPVKFLKKYTISLK